MNKIVKKQLVWYMAGLGIILILFFGMVIYNMAPSVKSITLSDKVNLNKTKTIYLKLVSYNNRDIYCKLIKNDESEGEWVKASNKICALENNSDNNKIYIKYNENKVMEITEKLKIEEILNIEINNSNKYLAVDSSFELSTQIDVIGNPNKAITYQSSDINIARIENNKVIGVAPGKATITAISTNSVKSSLDITVTDLIKNYTLDNKKPVVPCNIYSKEDADTLDAILLDIINTAGENTRGAVVGVARFLPLQFKYRVPYFFENGRLKVFDNRREVDGEGRYYHKGLFLHEDKIKELDPQKRLSGPAIWGCGLYNWDTSYGWARGVKYPNGLDCSGFVSWVLYNAGFDVGDVGSGLATWTNLTSYGKLNEITYEYANSKKYKVGDLIGWDGHIAIIAGLDEENIYVAESLLPGVVIEKFSIVDSNSKFYRLYDYIIDMEDYYQSEGKYTNIW